MGNHTLQNITVAAPGFLGLNTEESPIGGNPAFAAVADNCVIDKLGRVAARKGYEELTTNGSTVLGTSVGLESCFEFVSRTGVTTVFSAGNNKLFSGTTTLVECTLPVGYTINDNNWKVVSFNNDVYFFQTGHAPLESVGGSTTLTLLQSSGQNVPPEGNEVLAAFGRIWSCDIVNNKYTIYWSDFLNGADWHGGGSGAINLTEVWPSGYDEVVSLAEHNGFLIVFGKRNIIIFKGADSPANNLAVEDTIEGVGCIARDSVQSTGSDLFFLSSRGVMSLGRLIQEKSLPLIDISKNVRSDILQTLTNETEVNGVRTKIKAIYSPIEAFYLLTFPESKLVYCFDLKQPLENGSYRATTWTSISPVSFCLLANDLLFMGHKTGIVKYAGYLDGTLKYQLRYFSHPLDFENTSNLKFLKKFNVTIIGGANTSTTLNWGYDYTTNFTKQTFTFGAEGVAEFGIAEYNTAEAQYTSSIVVNTPKVNTTGGGEVVTIGLEAEISSSQFSIQRIDIHALLGRLI